MSSNAGLLKERAGWLFYGAPVIYAAGGYTLGITGLLGSSSLQLSGGANTHVIPFIPQVKLYHRNRVTRIYNPQPENYPQGSDYLRTARSGFSEAVVNLAICI